MYFKTKKRELMALLGVMLFYQHDDHLEAAERCDQVQMLGLWTATAPATTKATDYHD